MSFSMQMSYTKQSKIHQKKVILYLKADDTIAENILLFEKIISIKPFFSLSFILSMNDCINIIHIMFAKSVTMFIYKTTEV